MGHQFEEPTVRALLVIETEPDDLGRQIGRRPLRPLTVLIGLVRQLLGKLRT